MPFLDLVENFYWKTDWDRSKEIISVFESLDFLMQNYSPDNIWSPNYFGVNLWKIREDEIVKHIALEEPRVIIKSVSYSGSELIIRFVFKGDFHVFKKYFI